MKKKEMNEHERTALAIVTAGLLGTAISFIIIGLRDSGKQQDEAAIEPIKVYSAAANINEEKFGYAIPYGDTSFKSYMDYRCITNVNSLQYALQNECWTDDKGLRRHNDDYVIAVGSYYSQDIGDRFEISLDSGETFTAVVGDFKADADTDRTHRYFLMQDGQKNIIEFIVDTNDLDATARRMGDISYISGFTGNIEKIERAKNA